MPPRPTIQCCRALQGRNDVSVDAVWVTDDVLSRAFRRYLDVSVTKRRAVSSAPGPMYHRKRFGRRQMTELNAMQSIGSLPVWALSNAPDMTNWRWQPPKPDLWSSPPPKATIRRTLEPPTPLETTVIRPAGREVERPPPLRVDFNPQFVMSFMKELKELHINSFSTADEYRAEFIGLVCRATKIVSRGGFTSSGVGEIYFAAFEHLETARRVHPELQTLFPYLMSSAARGIMGAKSLDGNFFVPTARFWEKWLEQLRDCEVNIANTKLLMFVMDNLRPRQVRRSSNLLLSVLYRYFDLWSTSDLHGEPEVWHHGEISRLSSSASLWSGRIDKLFKAMESDLADGQVQRARSHMRLAEKLLARVQRIALKQAHLIMRYNWLQILARLPNVQTDEFKQLLCMFAPNGHAALSYMELCDLFLLHWSSQGMLTDPDWTRSIWNNIRGKDDHFAIAALALAVNKTNTPKQCTAIFWNLWSLLRFRGGPKKLLRQLSLLSDSRTVSSAFLQRLAWTSNDHRVALLLHFILCKQEGRVRNFWWPAFWDKFAAKQTTRWKYPQIDPILLARKMTIQISGKQPLNPLANQTVESSYEQQLMEVESESVERQLDSYEPVACVPKTKAWVRQVKRIQWSLKLLLHARQLTDRQALHYVTAFTGILANKQGHLSARDLATLTSVIMRTLDQGKTGSVERLRWYLGIIYTHLGEQSCIRVGVILKRRREANWQVGELPKVIITQTRTLGLSAEGEGFLTILEEFEKTRS
ncbi:hypothetical protein M406DRAFT_351989 [Cryphonectria parasitica EP155]|uniref:Uncharacterized protein n=1 Tax=Cryphonectria parasitica (strain ATCC 38755 / EP155) TaxID=660469 RepID=A0A9P4Y1M3_CRYP1|nr:uncharacterized protein M406DRAFT_351989 [Cryphonectria parasitica EP155]KAF3764956.1 hypothetical protein M406DRAFT_351989 [Cryphonectria parasitica EP155]